MATHSLPSPKYLESVPSFKKVFPLSSNSYIKIYMYIHIKHPSFLVGGWKWNVLTLGDSRKHWTCCSWSRKEVGNGGQWRHLIWRGEYLNNTHETVSELRYFIVLSRNSLYNKISDGPNKEECRRSDSSIENA